MILPGETESGSAGTPTMLWESLVVVSMPGFFPFPAEPTQFYKVGMRGNILRAK
jgi:hypothetical protein